MQIEVTASNEARRLDKFLLSHFNAAPRSLLLKLLRKGAIKLNERKAGGSEVLAVGDVVRVFLADDTIAGMRKPVDIAPAAPLGGIIYEDEDLLVVDKPAGLASQGGAGIRDHLQARIAYYSPGAAVCNRLDTNTSGVVIAGKHPAACARVNAAFAARQVEKEYLAVVEWRGGELSRRLVHGYEKDADANKARILPAGEGMEIITEYRVREVSACGKTAVLAVFPITGRSHQIRAHLAHVGAPILGDIKYGAQKKGALMLHCCRIKIAGQEFAAAR
jgi:23S rRNA pseudouridine955/2504/2580 synthase